MGYLRNHRRTEITITSSTHHFLLGRRYIFDSEGKLTSDFGSVTPEWLLTLLSQLVLAMPHVSGTDTIEISKPEDKDFRATALVERYLDITLGEVIDIDARRFPDKEAIVDATAEVRLTYRELKEKYDHLARHLIDLGVKKGETVAVISPNSYEQFVSKFAIIKSGAVIVNISPYEKAERLKCLLRNTDAVAVIMKPGVKAEELIEAMYEICPEMTETDGGEIRSASMPKLRTVIVAGSTRRYPGTLRFETLMAEPAKCTRKNLTERTLDVEYRDVATIIHTSGTTGVPKGVMLTHGAIVENASEHVKVLGVTGRDRIFMPVPMFHALGSVGSCYTAIIAGATIVCMARAKPQAVLELLSREKCTLMFSVPSHYISLVETVHSTGFDTNRLCLQEAVMAGDKCSEKVITDTQSVLGARDVLVMYGMTEAGPGISSTRLNDPLEVKVNTVGRPWCGEEVKLLNTYANDSGETVGEICVRGYNVMKGYYNDRAETLKAIDADGWLHTGDLGMIRLDGNIVIKGRLKDIIIRNGENISPSEIEHFLSENPAVDRAIVVGANDYRYGESIYAFIVVKTGCEITEDDLRTYCKGRMPSIKIPESFTLVEDFPRSPTGKILISELRVRAQKMHDENTKQQIDNREAVSDEGNHN